MKTSAITQGSVTAIMNSKPKLLMDGKRVFSYDQMCMFVRMFLEGKCVYDPLVDLYWFKMKDVWVPSTLIDVIEKLNLFARVIRRIHEEVPSQSLLLASRQIQANCYDLIVQTTRNLVYSGFTEKVDCHPGFFPLEDCFLEMTESHCISHPYTDDIYCSFRLPIHFYDIKYDRKSQQQFEAFFR